MLCPRVRKPAHAPGCRAAACLIVVDDRPAASPPVSAAMALAVATVAIARSVHFVVPGVMDEVDWLAAGVIPSAVLAPVLHVARRHAPVDRLGGAPHPAPVAHPTP